MSGPILPVYFSIRFSGGQTGFQAVIEDFYCGLTGLQVVAEGFHRLPDRVSDNC